MKELKTLEQKIACVMEDSEASRNDDWTLTWLIYHTFYGVGLSMPFVEVMNRHRDLGLPTPESIARIRRKLQEREPKKYGPASGIKEFRHQRDVMFYDYAKEIV